MMENPLETGSSLIHGLDPRIRIMAAVFISFAAALCHHPLIGGAYLAAGMVLIFMARIPFHLLWPRLKPLTLFLIMIWVFLPLTFTRDMIHLFGPVQVSLSGVRLAAMISIKSFAIIIIFTALLATMPMAALGKGLHQIRVPDKLVFLLLMTYRYIYVIRDEYQRLYRAARFRGFAPGANLHSYKTYAYLAGMLFVRASFRAKRVYQAMICRGFSQTFHTLDIYLPNKWNPVFFAAMIGLGTALTIIDRVWIYS